MKQKAIASSNNKFKIRLWKVLVIILSAFIIALLIVIAQEVQFRNRYVLPRSIRLRLLNGSYPVSPTIYINDKAYIYRYFLESSSGEYLDKLPDTFEELSREENDLKTVAGNIYGLDENPEKAWLPIKEELTGKVYMSCLHPNVALLYFDEERRGLAFSEPNRYYYLIKSDLLDARVSYKGHDYEFNFLTHNYTTKDLPKDLKVLSPNDFAVDNDFLRGQSAYISGKTGMIYIEAFEDTVYIPFERPEYIKALAYGGLFGFDWFLPQKEDFA